MCINLTYQKNQNETNAFLSCAVFQSYEIKLPPRAILEFKILDIFSVEN